MNGAPNVVQFGGGERRICCWAFMVSVKNFRLTTLDENDAHGGGAGYGLAFVGELAGGEVAWEYGEIA